MKAIRKWQREYLKTFRVQFSFVHGVVHDDPLCWLVLDIPTSTVTLMIIVYNRLYFQLDVGYVI